MDVNIALPIREITEHKVNPANDKLQLLVVDLPGAGGANHRYEIRGITRDDNPSLAPDERIELDMPVTILFQNGAINEAGVNGLTHEVLLAIVADRLRSFQDGPYRCKENACALTHIEEALHWLQSRTLKRMQRGVEGTHTV